MTASLKKTLLKKKLMVALCVFSGVLFAAGNKLPLLSPVGAPDSFSTIPNKNHEYVFDAENFGEGENVPWQITDFSGKNIVCQGTAEVKDRKWKISTALPVGFYELRVDRTNQLFGISVLPEPQNAPDLFFAMEALLYNKKQSFQESCLKFLEKHHIVTNRDWTQFHQLSKNPGEYNGARDSVYQRAADHHIKSIYAFSTFAPWQGLIRVRNNPFALPRKLIDFDTALIEMYESRKAGTELFQTLNEFDSNHIPAESFMGPIRAAAWAMREHQECLLGGAAFCMPGDSIAMTESMANHMLDYIDVFAFHFYGAPEDLLERTEVFRKSMQAHPQKAWMPIWITESGRPWKRGRNPNDLEMYSGIINNKHPQAEEDTQSALWITMKAVEGKTMGIERYFPFTMTFFQENDNNFGMMDYHGTPLRSLHSYVFAADLLAGKEYIGDPARPSSKMKRERIFLGGKQAVVVFYGGKNSHLESYLEADVSRFPEGKGYAMTGREVQTQNGLLRFTGGLAYWVFPAEKLDWKTVNSATRSMTLLQKAKEYKKMKRFCSPVIFRYKFWKEKNPLYNKFVYFLKDKKCVFSITNLDVKEQVIQPVISLSKGVTLQKPLPKTIVIPPRSETELVLELEPGKADSVEIRLKDAGQPLTEIVSSFVFLENLRSVALDDIFKPECWKENSSGKQRISFNKQQNALEIYTDFRNKNDPAAGNWSFPEFSFQKSEQTRNLIAISFDLMIEPKCYGINTQKWKSLQIGNQKNRGKYDSSPCREACDKWKSFTIYVYSGNDVYSFFRIGMGTEGQELTYYIRNVKLHYAGR